MFTSLRTCNFRNLADAETDTAAKKVFLVGENGQGKTNFLEALYFCCYGSSFRGAKDGEIARAGAEAFSAAASLSGGAHGELRAQCEKSKTLFLDGKKVADRKDLLEVAPCVAFCHEDMEFVAGSQERRRWFFDQTQSLFDPVYLDDLRRYRKALKMRNAVLRDARESRTSSASLLDALDPQLAEYGGRLMEKRACAARRFSEVFSPLYAEVAGIEGVGVSYRPSWKKAQGAVLERREADLAAGLTLVGPHRDRYVFGQDGAGDFSGTASTGQRRLLALLLRVAQARRFSEASGRFPMLLLDDVLLELDGEKRRRFLSVLPECEQAFFTFLPEEPYPSYGAGDTIAYRVAGGALARVSL